MRINLLFPRTKPQGVRFSVEVRLDWCDHTVRYVLDAFLAQDPRSRGALELFEAMSVLASSTDDLADVEQFVAACGSRVTHCRRRSVFT